MRGIAFLLYELTREDIARLPVGFEVLEIDGLQDRSTIKHVGAERFKHEGGRYRHYAMKLPPLSAPGLVKMV